MDCALTALPTYSGLTVCDGATEEEKFEGHCAWIGYFQTTVPKINNFMTELQTCSTWIEEQVEHIDDVKAETDENIAILKALFGNTWGGEWNDTDDFAGKTVMKDGIVYGSLVVPPDTQINDMPPSENWEKLSFEVVDDLTPELGGNLECGDKTFNHSSYRSLNLSTTYTTNIDFSQADIFNLDCTEATTFQFDNFPSGSVAWINITSGNDYTITYPTECKFVGGKLPKLSDTGIIDRLQIEKMSNGDMFVFLLANDIRSAE